MRRRRGVRARVWAALFASLLACGAAWHAKTAFAQARPTSGEFARLAAARDQLREFDDASRTRLEAQVRKSAVPAAAATPALRAELGAGWKWRGPEPAK